ncbi:MAG: hypothetical protein EBZ10_04765 [Actinobacteria bacterium]|nr:hypothetical protein [Actinomycetota bacterium]
MYLTPTAIGSGYGSPLRPSNSLALPVPSMEMQSLGLNVEVIDDEGRVVVLKDEEFESDRAAEELGINLSRNENLSAESDFNTYQ